MKLLLLGAAMMGLVASASADSTTLTLTTYNIHSGIPSGHSNASYFAGMKDLRNVADVLTSSGADIIALQEVRNKWPYPPKIQGKAPDMALELAKLLDMHYVFGSTLKVTSGYVENRDYLQWGSADKSTSMGVTAGHYGNAILSRFAMSKPEIIKLPMAAKNDPEKTGDEARNAIRSVIGVPGFGRMVVYGTHFQHNNGRTRESQMRALLERAAADVPTATVLLMGDFNHSPRPGEPDLLDMVKEAGFHDLAAEYSAETGQPLEPTMPGKKGAIRIDYIFSSKPLKVKRATVTKTDVSDHYPLTVVVEAGR